MSDETPLEPPLRRTPGGKRRNIPVKQRDDRKAYGRAYRASWTEEERERVKAYHREYHRRRWALGSKRAAKAVNGKDPVSE